MLNIGGFDSQTQMNTPLVAHMNVLMEHLKKYRRRGRRVIHTYMKYPLSKTESKEQKFDTYIYYNSRYYWPAQIKKTLESTV